MTNLPLHYLDLLENHLLSLNLHRESQFIRPQMMKMMTLMTLIWRMKKILMTMILSSMKWRKRKSQSMNPKLIHMVMT